MRMLYLATKMLGGARTFRSMADIREDQDLPDSVSLELQRAFAAHHGPTEIAILPGPVDAEQLAALRGSPSVVCCDATDIETLRSVARICCEIETTYWITAAQSEILLRDILSTSV